MKSKIKLYIDSKTYNRLISGRNSAGKLYGTCKIRIENLPLRPIVSMINTPTYKLAKSIDIIIKPYIPKHMVLKIT